MVDSNAPHKNALMEVLLSLYSVRKSSFDFIFQGESKWTEMLPK